MLIISDKGTHIEVRKNGKVVKRFHPKHRHTFIAGLVVRGYAVIAHESYVEARKNA